MTRPETTATPAPGSLRATNPPAPGGREQLLAQALRRIERERMAAIPLLNRALSVEVVGFRPWSGTIPGLRLGVVITPWFMNLTLLATGETTPWDRLAIGERVKLMIGDGEVTFAVNEVESFGRCLNHPLHSPMRQFASQVDAVDVAEGELMRLTRPADSAGKRGVAGSAVSDLSDESEALEQQALDRFMAGDDSVYNPLDPLADPFAPPPEPVSQQAERERISRRDLLWGNLMKEHSTGG